MDFITIIIAIPIIGIPVFLLIKNIKKEIKGGGCAGCTGNCSNCNIKNIENDETDNR